MTGPIEVFFDGACPLCAREMRWFTRLDGGRQRLRFVDIAAPGFDASSFGLDPKTILARIHARLPDGSFATGVEVFRLMYSAVGFGPLVWLSRIPGVSQLLDFAYEKFAKNRLRLTGRCEDGACEVPARAQAPH